MILVLSYPNDVHAAAVQWILEEYFGRETASFFASDFPQKKRLSISVDGHGSYRNSFGAHDELTRPTTVWLRRLTRPVPSPSTHPDDLAFVEVENRFFMDGYLAVQWDDALWVNDQMAATRANSKAVQLLVARKTGWRVPRTLFSNDPAKIREFFLSNKATIYKPFLTPLWKSKDGKSHTTLTTELTDIGELGDAVLSDCAGIFQEKIFKEYEVRVTVMGGTCFAVKILSQTSNETQTDWRMGFYGKMSLEPIRLPHSVERQCVELLSALGLVFGAIDLAVTPDGEYVFFEVNEMGQFLWIEEACQSIPLLDAFAKFLISADQAFVYDDHPRSGCGFAEVFANSRFREYLADRVRDHGEHRPGTLYEETA